MSASKISKKSPTVVTGLSPSALAYYIAEVVRATTPSESDRISNSATIDGSLLVVCPSTAIAEHLLVDLRFYFSKYLTRGIPVIGEYLSWEILPFDLLSPALSIASSRLHTLYRLALGKPLVVVATVESLMQRIVPKQLLLNSIGKIEKGQEVDREALAARLIKLGYIRSSLVEEIGQVAVRGSVVDLFPPGFSSPVRLELFGDTIESIRKFQSGSQRSQEEISEVEILPVREFFLPDQRDPDLSAISRLRDAARKIGVLQRKIVAIEDAIQRHGAWPGIEHLQPIVVPELETVWDYLPASARVMAIDMPGIEVAGDEFYRVVVERYQLALEESRLAPSVESAYLNVDEFEAHLTSRLSHESRLLPFVSVDQLYQEPLGLDAQTHSNPRETGESVNILSNEKLISALSVSRIKSKQLKKKSTALFQPLADYIRKAQHDGFRIAVVVGQLQRIPRMIELLTNYELSVEESGDTFLEWSDKKFYLPNSVSVLHGVLKSGLRIVERKLLIISDAEIFPELSTRGTGSDGKQVKRFVGALAQIGEGDFVVHLDYGIGKYRGLRQVNIEGGIGEFLELEYAEEAKLLIPVDNIGKLQKYNGVSNHDPELTRLGGPVWEKTKLKVKQRVAELAGQLLNTMAARELAKGHAFPKPDDDDSRFADLFPYEETPDQTKAIEDVLKDLSGERPMDRLVCGDVGYGKTEIALRAAFKVANSGKQVAVLVPTTILADQHFSTFQQRFEATPIRVGCISRFYTAQSNRETLEGISNGTVDIVIGTHRLLQSDVQFRDLGLVIVDEEHRFGVGHKERLKRLRAEVHFLTLSATPIPRTLHMSLVGLRDLSLIETAPVNRQVIRTYLANYDQSVVREAILRELQRSGQVFYIHNRVQNISLIVDELREIVPEARIDFAHGQMHERELENVMHRFSAHEIDVLVSTTIVESGLDIPNANTIIIRSAEHFGLAELYQLRGRVGRSSRRAYSYLLIAEPDRLGDEAKKRLQVLQSLDDLGVGFRLALQDMEIRGAGNLLGKDQSGQVSLVGYELYSRILKDAVEELRRRKYRQKPAADTLQIDPEIVIGFPTYIPPTYVPDVSERLILYQRLVELQDEAEADQLSEEIKDRFGVFPAEVVILIEYMILRVWLKKWGITSARLREGNLSLSLHPQSPLKVERILELIKSSKGLISVSPNRGLSISYPGQVKAPSELTLRLKRIFLEQ